jgi:hypothetical protein
MPWNDAMGLPAVEASHPPRTGPDRVVTLREGTAAARTARAAGSRRCSVMRETGVLPSTVSVAWGDMAQSRH